MRTGFRTVLIDTVRLTGNQAEQPAKILHQTTPHLRRNAQTIENRSKVLWRGALLARNGLTSRPVQQAQIIGRRHRQETLVATTLIAFVCTRPCMTGTLVKIHSSQMTAAACLRWSGRTYMGTQAIVFGTANAVV
jgi:hypothetical protein